MSTEMDVVKMLTDVAVLQEKVNHLTDMLEKQNKVLERQDAVLENLVALANQGKGSLWMLITVGAFIGALVTNLKSVWAFFVR